MKIILVIMLVITVVASMSDNTWTKNVADKGCLTKDPVKALEVMTCLKADTSTSQCKYMFDNFVTQTQEWSVEYGANFHGCMKKSKCRDGNTELMDCLESCSYPVMKISLALLAIFALFM